MDNKKINSEKSNSKFIKKMILLAICLFLILCLIKEVVCRFFFGKPKTAEFREMDESGQKSIDMNLLLNKSFKIPTSVTKTDCENFIDELETRKIAPPAPFKNNQNSKKIAEIFNEGLQFVFFRMEDDLSRHCRRFKRAFFLLMEEKKNFDGSIPFFFEWQEENEKKPSPQHMPFYLMGYPTFSRFITKDVIQKSIEKYGFIIITFDIRPLNFDVHVVCKFEKASENGFQLTLYRSLGEKIKDQIYESEAYKTLLKMFQQKKLEISKIIDVEICNSNDNKEQNISVWKVAYCLAFSRSITEIDNVYYWQLKFYRQLFFGEIN